MRFVLLSLCTLGFTGSRLLADGKSPTYADDVLPIFKQSCVSCHGDDKQKGGLNLASFSNMQQGGSSGAVVVPGDPDKSRLYLLASHKDEPKMPPKADKLADAQLNLMKLWIEQGAHENAAGKVMAPAKPKVDLSLKVSTRGKPEGLPPMPKLGALPLDPATRGRRPGAVVALAASPWAPLVAVGGPKEILLYHADTFDLLGVLPFAPGQVNSLKFSRSGKLLLAAGGRGGQSGKAVLFEVETGKVVTEVGTETDALLSADISADQSQIAVGGPSKIVRCYSTADGSVLHEIKKHTEWVTAVEFSPDGVLLASGDRNGGLFVWEAGTGREFYALKGHKAAVTDLSWRADGNLLATVGEDGAVILFEMENGNPVKTWAAHGGGAAAVRFAPDGTLVTTGRDRVTKHWDAAGNLKKQFDPFPDLGLRVAVTHDGLKVVAGDWSGQTKVWTLADGKVASTLDVNPPPLAEQVKQLSAAVATAETAVTSSKAALVIAQANLAKATEGVAAAQKVAIDLATAAQNTTQSLNPMKAEADKAAAAVVATTQVVAAKEVLAEAFTEAAKKVHEAAAKSPQNPELPQVAKKADETAKQASDELATAKKALADAQGVVGSLSAKIAEGQKAAGVKAAEAAEAQKRLTAVQAAMKPAQDAATKSLADTKAAESVLAATKAKFERFQAVAAGKK